MKIYHGSKLKIEKPVNHGSKITNDYGPAFYLTRDLESAKEWSCRNNSIGVVNVYDFRTENLKILDLTKYSVLNWLAILLHNRLLTDHFKNQFDNRIKYLIDNYYIDLNDYDLVIGYRADDAYFRFPLDFVSGNITLEQLKESFMLGEMGIQYVVLSEKGISHLKFKESIISEEEYIGKYYQSVNNATERYDKLPKDTEGTYITDLIRKK